MREPACLQIPLLAVKTGQPRFARNNGLRRCGKKKALKNMRASFCLAVRTRLELATPCVTGMYSNQTELPNRTLLHLIFQRTLFISQMRVQKYNFFLNPPNKNAHFLKYNSYNTILQRIKKQTFFTHHRKNSLKTVYFAAIFRKIEPFLCKETSKNTYN